MSAKNSAIKDMNTQSKAEGDAIHAERMNTTIRNSYNAAFGQMQLGLKRKQAAEQGAGIGAATLAAKSDVALANAATGSMGASTNAVLSDIDQKSQAAYDANAANFENTMEQYNADLDLMVMNTSQSEPNVRPVVYNGPSDGAILGMAVAQGAVSFASSYASKKMSLGAGPKYAPGTQAPSPVRVGVPI